MIATSQFTISVINDGKDGQPGAIGPQGVSVLKVISEYRLSDSSLSLTGDYEWSETMPEVPSGKYLWIRERTDLSDNTTTYSTAHCDVVISGLVFDVDKNTQAITSKIWESDISSSISEYDNTTAQSIRDRVTQTETNISGINTTISDVQSTLETKADGSTVATMQTQVNNISDTVDGHTQTISNISSRLDDDEDEISSVKTTAEQTADRFSWIVEDGSTSSSVQYTANALTAMANQIDLTGKVTFNSFDTDTQNALTSDTELIIGTQTSSTSAWTGKSNKLKTITAGTRISYKLPYASTSTLVTLNLTLSDNTTTSAIPVYYLDTTRVTTQYGVNAIVQLIYDGNAWRVLNPYADSNTYDRTRYQQAIKAGTAITTGNIIVAGANNAGTYMHLKSGNPFDTTYPILYAASAISANGTGTNNYLIYPLTLTTTQSGTYVAYRSVYIKGTLSGTTFTPVSTTPLTQTLPTAEDGYHYLLLGTTYSTSEMYLLGEHPIFMYYNGGFKTVAQIAAEAAVDASNAVETANEANENAENAVEAVSSTIKSTTMHYLATSADSGVTRSTPGWTTTIQTITSTNKYLWTYQTYTKVDDTTIDTDPVISGVYGADGGKGDDGIGVVKVEQLYRTSSSTTAPPAPVSVVTSTSTSDNIWTLAMPTYNVNYPYYHTCIQTTCTNGMYVWTTVTRSGALEDANREAYNANTNAANAVNTANTANSNATSAVNTANNASNTANSALNGLKAFTGTSSTAVGTAAKEVSCSDNTFALINGVTITITFSTASTAEAPTLNVNSSGAKAIYFGNAVTSASNRFHWQAGSVITFQYNGTYWVVLNYENLEYFTSSTNAASAAKTNASLTGTFVLCKGTTINVYFSTANTAASPTLNIGSTGAYAIYYKNAVTSSSNLFTWDAGATLSFTYNGSYWYVNDGSALVTKNYAKPAVDWVGTNGAKVVTATGIMQTWTGDATLATTTIDGGYIKSHTIESEHLATNAIMSSNFQAISGSHFSSIGSYLDLSSGDFFTPNFGVSASNGSQGAYINGEVVATSGRFGADNTSYWNIETITDYNNAPHAALVGSGSPFIQTGNWQMNDNSVATRKFTTVSGSLNKADYYKDTGTNTYYDVGMKIPTNFSGYSQNDSPETIYTKSFFYGRKYTGNSVPAFDSGWTYMFMVDTDGNLYENGIPLYEKYASIDGVHGQYLPLEGGIITGNLTVQGTLTANASTATKWNSAQTVYVTLNTASTTTTIQGGSSTAQTIGVNGTLGIGNGGTGKTSWTQYGIVYATATNALGQMAVGTSGQVLTSKGNAAPAWTNQSALSVGSATKATQDGDGSVISTTYRKLDNGQFDTIDVTELTTGDLMVTGAGRFTNGLYGNLNGNVVGNVTGNISGSAGSVVNNLKIQLNGGTTEGTNQFTYNGSAVKNINITKSSIGLGNVENTALSTWAGSSNLTSTKVGTLAAAATKGVDTNISAASTSANLPTSAAVASFVEGKGYVTTSGVTSVQVQATSPVVSSQNAAQSTTLNTTISLADAYGDTKNPYGTKTANYVLAGPSSGNAAAPTFRKLVASDIPSITKSKISDFPTTWALSSVTGADDLKAIEALNGTSGILKKTAANAWGLTTVVQGLSIDNDSNVLRVTMSDNTTQDLSIDITGQVVTGATILSDADGNAISLGSASAPVYFLNGVPAQANVIPTIALNGSTTTTASFYAPTSVGTNNQYLKSNGSGAPSWATFSKSTVGLGNVDNTADANKNVLTATKFSSSRTIALTGDVTGSASGDGSSGWSIATTVGDDTHNHTYNTIVPLQTKAYTGVIATANDQANAALYFMKVQPDSYTGSWSIKYNVTATIAGVSAANGSGYESSVVQIYGMRDTYSAYSTWNNISNTSYRPYYYHCFYRAKEAGITGGYGHALGVNLLYSYLPTTTANSRTITVEIMETHGCTVTFLDSPVKYANWPGTGSTNYNTYNNFDGTTNGVTVTGDRNDVNYYNRNYYGLRTAYAAIYRYQLCLTKKDRSLLPINSVDNSVATDKTLTTEAFDPFGDIVYWSSTTTYAAGANVGDGWYAQYLCDIRYSFNIGGNTATSTLVGRKPLYLVATPQSDGTAKLYSNPLAQDLPTSDNGLIYIYLGQVYPDTNPYRLYLSIQHPIYWYKNGAVRPYIMYPANAVTADSATSASKATAANLTSTTNAIAYYTNTTGTFGSKASANGALYATSANGALNWGTLPVGQGGTGVTTFTSGQVLIGNGTSAITTRAIDTTPTANSTNLITSGAVSSALGSYVTLSTTQTISGTKTFSAATSFTNTTASTSKSTGAVKVSGGMGVAGRMSSNEVMIGDHAVLQYNANTASLDIIFS